MFQPRRPYGQPRDPCPQAWRSGFQIGWGGSWRAAGPARDSRGWWSDPQSQGMPLENSHPQSRGQAGNSWETLRSGVCFPDLGMAVCRPPSVLWAWGPTSRPDLQHSL